MIDNTHTCLYGVYTRLVKDIAKIFILFTELSSSPLSCVTVNYFKEYKEKEGVARFRRARLNEWANTHSCACAYPYIDILLGKLYLLWDKISVLIPLGTFFLVKNLLIHNPPTHVFEWAGVFRWDEFPLCPLTLIFF